MKQKSDVAQWAVQFFFKTPTHFPVLAADDLRIATVTKSGWAQIVKLQEKVQSLKRFLENADKQYVLICSIRVSAKTAHKAILRPMLALNLTSTRWRSLVSVFLLFRPSSFFEKAMSRMPT